ncbi:MAG: hypothetical protein IJC68_02640 [Firmicutes bacterium]|nr:hypothetical protein [Bacillota bacterium]
MIQETITYLQVGAPENTKIALELAVEAAREQGIKDLVVASTVGTTAAMLADEIDCSGLHVTIVGHAFDQKEPGTNPMAPELRQHLKDKGFDVIHAAHALSHVLKAYATGKKARNLLSANTTVVSTTAAIPSKIACSFR